MSKARTFFGCENLILAELDQPSLKCAQGINVLQLRGYQYELVVSPEIIGNTWFAWVVEQYSTGENRAR
jgi:hypothetical protein